VEEGVVNRLGEDFAAVLFANLEFEPRPNPWQRRVGKPHVFRLRSFLVNRRPLKILIDGQIGQHAAANITFELPQSGLEGARDAWECKRDKLALGLNLRSNPTLPSRLAE